MYTQIHTLYIYIHTRTDEYGHLITTKKKGNAYKNNKMSVSKQYQLEGTPDNQMVEN